jgi:RNA polymerase sigma-70 factor (ECF subfamily)
LIRQRRKHIGAAIRSVELEQRYSESSSVLLATRMVEASSPKSDVLKAEEAERVRDSVAQLSDSHSEIILLRNFEGLTNQEAAHVLGIEPDAARKRYGRALVRLRGVLAETGITELRL